MSVQVAITKVNIYKKDLQAAVTEGQAKCVKVEPQVSGPCFVPGDWMGKFQLG